jgi:hypothetical protein
MNPCRFSFNVAHPGLGVKEKLPASAPCFLSRRSCRGAASFNKVFQRTVLALRASPAVVYRR